RLFGRETAIHRVLPPTPRLVSPAGAPPRLSVSRGPDLHGRSPFLSEIPIPVATRPWREVLRFALKALITAALLYWLIRSDTLEFGKVKLLVSSAEIFLVTALTWLFVAVGLSTVRWLCILR